MARYIAEKYMQRNELSNKPIHNTDEVVASNKSIMYASMTRNGQHGSEGSSANKFIPSNESMICKDKNAQNH